jgi:single-strand DNA-binding protein
MLNKLVRIGKDATLRFTANNTPVISLDCVYDIGWGDKKKSQWIECAIWGKQAEALAKYLTKGKQVVIYADDVEVEQYEHNGKTGTKLKCRVINIDLTDNKESQAPQQTQAPQKQQQPDNSQDFDDSFDDAIPF